MKRVGLGLSLACACAAAGLFAAFALADGPPGGTTTTGTTTAAPALFPEGVTIGGVPVGGLTATDAAGAIRDSFSTPLPLEFASLTFAADPVQLAAPNVKAAIARARDAPPGANVELVVVVRTARVRAYVATIAKRIDRAAADSRLLLRHLRPFLTKERPGRTVLRATAEHEIANELRRNARDTVELQTKQVPPTVARKDFGPVIVIHRASNRLFLFNGMRFWRVFPVATGQSVYPTPLGRFQIVVKWKDPWWYPPNSPWAQGEKPVPPGPGNPLGPRWMGPLRARRRHPRHEQRELDRLLRVARVHPDARDRRRVAVRPRRDRHNRLHRRRLAPLTAARSRPAEPASAGGSPR